jgi:hypothetical protein
VNLPLGGGFKHTPANEPLQDGWRGGRQVGQSAPSAALRLPTCGRSHLPELAFGGVVGSRAGRGEKHQCLLDARRQIDERHDLHKAGSTDLREAGELGVVGHLPASHHLVEHNGVASGNDSG